MLAALPGAEVLPLTEEDEEFDSDIALLEKSWEAQAGTTDGLEARNVLYFRMAINAISVL